MTSSGRRALPVRPSWFAIFLKAYGLVSQHHAPIRQSYLSFPWARLHQHGCSVGHVAIARRIGAEDVVLGLQIRHPERKPLADLDNLIRRARTEPVERFAQFRRAVRLAWFPTPIRRLVMWGMLHTKGDWCAELFGTFGLTSVGALGATSLTVISPLTSTLAYGAFEADGSVLVRLFYDHRVMDGVQPAAVLADLERVLLGPIAAELRADAANPNIPQIGPAKTLPITRRRKPPISV